MYFGKAIKLWSNHTGGVHFPVIVVTKSSLVCNVPKGLGILFLSLLVASLVIVLQVVVSAYKAWALSI